MTMVVNTLKEFAGVQHEHAVYIKDANALLRIYRESVAVVDLTNAMQAGKTCKNTALYLLMLITVSAAL